MHIHPKDKARGHETLRFASHLSLYHFERYFYYYTVNDTATRKSVRPECSPNLPPADPTPDTTQEYVWSSPLFFCIYLPTDIDADIEPLSLYRSTDSSSSQVIT